MARNRVGSCLRIDEKHPEFSRVKASEVDDACTALLTHARTRPPHLSASTAAAYHGAGFWLGGQPGEELDALVLGLNLRGVSNEGRGFDNRQHATLYVWDVSRACWLRPLTCPASTPPDCHRVLRTQGLEMSANLSEHRPPRRPQAQSQVGAYALDVDELEVQALGQRRQRADGRDGAPRAEQARCDVEQQLVDQAFAQQ